MAGIKVYGTDYTDDLRELRGRGHTVREAAHIIGISERSAYRLLADQRREQEAKP